MQNRGSDGACVPQQALCGEYWSTLPASVRSLHMEGHATGTLAVTLGRHALARILARILGFPRASAASLVTLWIRRSGDWLEWRRAFDAVQLVSRQRAEGGLLRERFGLLELAFGLEQLTSTGFVYAQRQAALVLGPLRIRLPRALSPIAHGVVEHTADGVAVSVRLRLPGIGDVISYHGVMRRVAES